MVVSLQTLPEEDLLSRLSGCSSVPDRISAPLRKCQDNCLTPQNGYLTPLIPLCQDPSSQVTELRSYPPNPQDNVFTQLAMVTPYLYLAAATALSPNTLEERGVSLVINMTRELPILPVDGASSIRVEVEDNPQTDLLSHFESLCCLIREERERGGVVLVHCVAGVSRSASLCLAYLVKHYCSLNQAWRHVKTIRPWVRPNHSFMAQLVEWEVIVRPETTIRTSIKQLTGSENPPKRKESCGSKVVLANTDKVASTARVS